ncbi:MAG: rRNA maturation RNase YbeY [Clostridiales bacterium]|jgi:probable rRNA maturation factor|nr:rRNA maturation RNase YbeY [Clostridiales bacterium]
MKHKILISRDRGVKAFAFYRGFLRKTIKAALKAETVFCPCEVNILLTGEIEIRKINRTMRGQDKPTDVLSFPAFDFIPGAFAAKPDMTDCFTGMLPLGDMVISMDCARAQAHAYGHSLKREIAYLAVHSVLHLLGYDHMDESAQKRIMRQREENILNRIGHQRKEAPGK